MLRMIGNKEKMSPCEVDIEKVYPLYVPGTVHRMEKLIKGLEDVPFLGIVIDMSGPEPRIIEGPKEMPADSEYIDFQLRQVRERMMGAYVGDEKNEKECNRFLSEFGISV